MSDIYSLDKEKSVLSGIIKFPKVFYESQRFLEEESFFHPTHKQIFSVSKRLIFEEQKEADPLVIVAMLKDVGIHDKDGLPIHEYVLSLPDSGITRDGTRTFIKDLGWLRYRRDVEKKGLDLVDLASSKKISDDEIRREVDNISSEKISSFFNHKTKPQKVAEGLREWAEERGNNPIDSMGLLTPFEKFNGFTGGLRPAEITLFSARGGKGKSTLINEFCYGTGKINKCPVLIIDTEMGFESIRTRFLASKSQAGFHYVETGKWRRNDSLISKVRSALDTIEEDNVGYYHMFIGSGTPALEVRSIILEWYYNEVGRGNPCVLGYDWLSSDFGSTWGNQQEYQHLGEKISILKDVAVEINAPLVTCCQSNRGGESYGKKGVITDDTTQIGGSDRFQMIAANVVIWRVKTIDEIILDEGLSRARAQEVEENRDWNNLRWGSHKMIFPKIRHQGEGSFGFHDMIRRRGINGQVTVENNYLSYSVENYGLVELGDGNDIIHSQQEQYELSDSESDDGETL
jgi:replicative DNA helicase